MNLEDLKDINLKSIAIPLGVVIGILLLALFGGKFILGKIGEINDEEKVLLNKSAQLTEKLQILQDFSLTSENLSSRVSLALPQSNPAVLGISQIKSKSESLSVVPQKINVGRPISPEGGLSYINIDFDLTGDMAQTLGFIEAITKTAPLGKVENVKFTKAEQGYNSTISYRNYWSDLPEKLPLVDDPLKNFDEEDLKVIQKLANLESPSGGTELSPQPQTQRQNPFGQ